MSRYLRTDGLSTAVHSRNVSFDSLNPSFFFEGKNTCTYRFNVLCNLQRATVTVMWPSKMEMEGIAPRKIDAERFAAAAACHKLRVSAVISLVNTTESNALMSTYLTRLSFFSVFFLSLCVGIGHARS